VLEWVFERCAGAAARSRRPVEVAPRPVDEDAQSVAKSDQVPQVQAEPREPSERPLTTTPQGQLGDGGVAPDRRHDALVVVVEGVVASPRSRAEGSVARSARPDSGWRPARAARRASAAQRHRRGVADGPHVGCCRSDAGRVPRSRPVRDRATRGRRCLGQRVTGTDAGRPDDGGALDPLAVVESDGVLFDLDDRSPELDLDARRFESSSRVGARALGKARQQARRDVDQDDADPGGVESEAVTPNGDLINSVNAPEVSTPVGPPPTTTNVRSTASLARSLRTSASSSTESSRLRRSSSVGQRIERHREPRGTLHTEECGRRARGDHEVVVADLRRVRERDQVV
jgi:hypothetical protein